MASNWKIRWNNKWGGWSQINSERDKSQSFWPKYLWMFVSNNHILNSHNMIEMHSLEGGGSRIKKYPRIIYHRIGDLNL